MKTLYNGLLLFFECILPFDTLPHLYHYLTTLYQNSPQSWSLILARVLSLRILYVDVSEQNMINYTTLTYNFMRVNTVQAEISDPITKFSHRNEQDYW